MKSKIITISGNIAVGKSEVAKLIAEKLDVPLYKASEDFRAYARKYNMNLVEFSEYIKDKPHIDTAIEQKTKEYLNKIDSTVVDARLGFFVAPKSFKVYMKAHIDVAAQRLYNSAKTRGKEEEYDSIENAKLAIIARENTEKERYMKIYNVDIHDKKNYDLIVDTTKKTGEDAADIIIKEYIKWLNN